MSIQSLTAPTTTPTTTPLRRDAAANRQRILAAAVEVFRTSGIDAGVDEIARRAGVGVGTLYRRFPTKEALVQAIVVELLSGLTRIAAEALQGPPETGLQDFLSSAGALQASHAGCLWQLWSSGDDADRVRAELRETLQRVLARGQHSGAVRSDLEYEDIWMVLWSLAGVVESVRDVAPDLWRRTLDLMLPGLRAAAASADGIPLAHPSLGAGRLDAVARAATARRSR